MMKIMAMTISLLTIIALFIIFSISVWNLLAPDSMTFMTREDADFVFIITSFILTVVFAINALSQD